MLHVNYVKRNLLSAKTVISRINLSLTLTKNESEQVLVTSL